jgi:hypothetical protein
MSDVSASILKIDDRVRDQLGVLILYSLIIVACAGIIIYILSIMYSMYRQWRVMAQNADPVSSSNPSALFSSNDGDPSNSFGWIRDDEVYQSDLADASGVTNRGSSESDRIAAGMDRLATTYAEYNKQMTDYSKNVLKVKGKPEDIFDRGVLDPANDDFK